MALSLHNLVNLPGKTTATLKDSTLLGVALSDHRKVDFSSSASRTKLTLTRRKVLETQAVATTSTPVVTRVPSEGKKTLRKGTVIITGASSGLDDMNQSDYPSKRLIIVGSITGNTNTLAGNVPPKANLGDMRGLAGGLNGLNSSTMIDGGKFDGAKAYKDSKICNMLTMQEFHRRYHEETAITFASLYPGCIATTGLFREHIPLFRLLFPPFQKFITKGYVSEDESGKRLAQVVSDPSLTKSGVYWGWNKDSASFENQLSAEASDVSKARKVWEISEKLVGLA
ncbi:hypothetical protein R6Q57_009051 [Mikania cordata]